MNTTSKQLLLVGGLLVVLLLLTSNSEKFALYYTKQDKYLADHKEVGYLTPQECLNRCIKDPTKNCVAVDIYKSNADLKDNTKYWCGMVNSFIPAGQKLPLIDDKRFTSFIVRPPTKFFSQGGNVEKSILPAHRQKKWKTEQDCSTACYKDQNCAGYSWYPPQYNLDGTCKTVDQIWEFYPSDDYSIGCGFGNPNCTGTNSYKDDSLWISRRLRGDPSIK